MIDFGLLCPAPQRVRSEGGTLELGLPLRIVLASEAQALFPLVDGALRPLVRGDCDALPRFPAPGALLVPILLAPLAFVAWRSRTAAPAAVRRSYHVPGSEGVCAENTMGAPATAAIAASSASCTVGALGCRCQPANGWPR